jgi:acetaldehyde dehydrogenase/alcohol dehydrogenase
MTSYMNVTNTEELTAALARCRQAQATFATYTQEQVDRIFLAAATAANKARIPLAKMAVEETGMGVVEDKVIKNHYAAEYIYNAYKNAKTCGVIEEDTAYGIKRIAEPIGVVAAVIPTTNPTSTAIFKALLCLKTRNAMIISPHPRAKNCTIAAAKLVLEAAVAAGAPEGIIAWIDQPSLELTNQAVCEALDGLPAHKVHCSVLAEEAIKNALKDYFDKNNIPYDAEKFKETDHDELHAQVHGE